MKVLTIALFLLLAAGWAMRLFAAGRTDPTLTTILEPIRLKYHLPALAAAVFTTDGVTEMAATGVRKAGTNISVTVDDLWHLGSETKAMTALLAGTFVVEKKLSWNDKVISFFPEIADRVAAPLRDVTVAQLMQHRAGLAANLTTVSIFDFHAVAGPGGLLLQQRIAAAEWFLTHPDYPSGQFHYSNGDYIVLGAILEKLGGKSWEELMRERVFGPLHMTSAGFGGTGTPGQIDQPWPHFANGQPAPSNGPAMDNLPYLGPAGTVHCSMSDWGKFLADQLRGGSGRPALLPAEIYTAMQTPPSDGDYAFGWRVTQRGWARGIMLSHAGSNTMNYAACWLGPHAGYGVLVCSNQGGMLDQAANEVAESVLRLYGR